MAALHDTLGSWLGLVYAATALFRSRDRIQIRLRIALALMFFVSISILHISSVITVRTVTSTVAFSLLATKMPGNMAHISTSDQVNNDLPVTITSIPYLWEQRVFGTGLPPGHNGTCVL